MGGFFYMQDSKMVSQGGTVPKGSEHVQVVWETSIYKVAIWSRKGGTVPRAPPLTTTVTRLFALDISE